MAWPNVSTSDAPSVTMGSALAATPVYITSASASPISTGPGTLWSLTAYTTSTGTLATAIPGVVRLHNTTTSSSTGATVVHSFPVTILATSTGGSLAGSPFAPIQHNFGPRGLSFTAACTVDVTTNSTGTTALANAKISAMYSTS